MNSVHIKNLKRNLFFNLLDGSFFGAAMGMASFVTVIPLFVSTMTNSAILIGLIPAIHSMGWQLPQLLTANRVSRQRRFKPMVLAMTINERLPFLGLAIVALLLPKIGVKLGLLLTFVLLIWQGLGGGFTATAWQSMIAKIFPADRRATFYGTQAAAANLLASGTAILAGITLQRLPSPQDYALCFLIAGIAMSISWFALAQTREAESVPLTESSDQRSFWNGLGIILRRDVNFRWFIVVRMLSQFSVMAFAFYTVYAVNILGMSDVTVGVLTGIFMGSQIIANPIMGWLGDHWSNRAVMEIGVLAAAASALLALFAPDPTWFALVFILAGIASVSIWTIGLSMVLEFGSEQERPAYIGLANTLIAPATILAPFLGGLLADWLGYPAAFVASVAGGLVTAAILQVLVKDPVRKTSALAGLPEGERQLIE